MNGLTTIDMTGHSRWNYSISLSQMPQIGLSFVFQTLWNQLAFLLSIGLQLSLRCSHKHWSDERSLMSLSILVLIGRGLLSTTLKHLRLPPIRFFHLWSRYCLYGRRELISPWKLDEILDMFVTNASNWLWFFLLQTLKNILAFPQHPFIHESPRDIPTSFDWTSFLGEMLDALFNIGKFGWI